VHKRRSRLRSTALLAVVGGVLAGLFALGSSPAVVGHQGSRKLRCKVVVRRVHGKRKRVRVCHKVKPTLPAGARLVATTAIGQPVTFVAAAGDATSVWLLDIYNGRALRVDPATNAVVASVPRPPLSDGSLAIGLGSVWETDFNSNTLVRIDPTTNRIAATIPLGADAAPEGVGVASDSVWVANHHLGTVSRIDPATNAVVATITVSPTGVDGPLTLAAGATGVWVWTPKTAEVVHIDPATNAIVGRIEDSGPPIVDADKAWIERPFTLDQIDPATNRIVKKIAVPQTVGRGVAGLGSVWIPTKPGLARVDESRGKLVGLRKGAPASAVAAVASDSIWLASSSSGHLLRFAPQ
jgi:virginiamycin B lyase